MEVKTFPRPDWEPVPMEDMEGVDGQVWLVDRRVVLAKLKFGHHTRSHRHSAEMDIHVLCLEGSGFAESADVVVPINAGESVLWPKGELHHLFTEDTSMTTLMVEHAFQLEKKKPGA